MLLALATATLSSRLLEQIGLSVVVDRATWFASAGVAVSATTLAAWVGARVLGGIDPREVLE